MYRYRLFEDGDDWGVEVYAEPVAPGDKVVTTDGRRLRVEDVVLMRAGAVLDGLLSVSES